MAQFSLLVSKTVLGHLYTGHLRACECNFFQNHPKSAKQAGDPLLRIDDIRQISL